MHNPGRSAESCTQQAVRPKETQRTPATAHASRRLVELRYIDDC